VAAVDGSCAFHIMSSSTLIHKMLLVLMHMLMSNQEDWKLTGFLQQFMEVFSTHECGAVRFKD